MPSVPLTLPNCLSQLEVIRDEDIIAERFQAYLGDESKLRGTGVSCLAFPRSADEVSSFLRESSAVGEAVTVSNARTGIVGGAVPNTRRLLSLSKMATCGKLELHSASDASIVVGAGLTLAALQESLQAQCLERSEQSFFFPVDPTETWAALGGMAATNASGARTFHYGPMRDWILWMRVVLADGSIVEVRRGQFIASAGMFQFETPNGFRVLVANPIQKPRTKNTIGYNFEEEIDLIDLFIGSEGTLGVITDIELRLAKTPPARLFYLQFFPSETIALDFVASIRSEKKLKLLAIEFLDSGSLRFIEQSSIRKTCAPAMLLSGKQQAAVYLEIELSEASEIEFAYETLVGHLEGADPEQSYAGTEERELRELKAFRHAVPETINGLIAKRKAEIPTLHKVATDMAVPDASLHEIYAFYVEQLRAAGFEYAIFGHAGNNHFHVNILPRSVSELQGAKELYRTFSKKVIELGGAVASEHGIGRMKKEFLLMQYSEEALDNMRKIRQFFDPLGILNPGVLFDSGD